MHTAYRSPTFRSVSLCVLALAAALVCFPADAPAAAKKQAAVPPPTPADAMQAIRNAIDRGVPAYNSGDHAGCTAIYKDTAQALLTRYAAALDEGSRARLRSALKTIEKQHRADKRAWELRYAMDDVYEALQKKDH